MSAPSCDLERMEALAFDELPLEEARRALEHASACAPCGAELASLREDRARFHARAGAQPALPRLELLARVEGAVQVRTRHRRVRREVAAFALCAASLLCAVGLSARSAPPGLQLSAGASSAAMCLPGCGTLGNPFAQDDCGTATVDEIGRLESSLGACLVATPLR
jgi:hypothetical protein